MLVDETLQPLEDYLRAKEPQTRSRSSAPAQPQPRRGAEHQEPEPNSQAGAERDRLDDHRLTAHSMRHTAITLAAAGGASLHQVQAMARHSDPKITMVYFHNLNRIQAGAEKCISF